MELATYWQVAAYLVVSLWLRLVAERFSTFPQAMAFYERPQARFLLSFLRFGYYIGLPYTALLLGALPARYLGLVGLEQLYNMPERMATAGVLDWLRVAGGLLLRTWLPDLGIWAGLTVLMAGLLVIIWRLYRHALRSVKNAHPASDASGSLHDVAALGTVVYAAVHWSFYRGGIWWLSDDLYLGVVGGAGLVCVEWGLCAWLAGRPWQHLASPRTLVDASLLFTTAAIFYYAPSLWLLIPAHWLLARLCRRCASAFPDLAHVGS